MIDFRSAVGRFGGGLKASGLSKATAFGVCAGLVVNAVVTGWLGLDFGWHWDEANLVTGLTAAVKDFSLLPRNYTYGGVYFGIGFLLLAPYSLPFLPEILREIAANPTRPLALDQYPAIVSLQSRLLARVDDPSFLLSSRGAFLVLSSLGALWVFAALRKLYDGQWLGAVAAAGFVAASWEVAYHSRFVSPDAVMMQFAALTFLLIIVALAERDHAKIVGWLLAAAGAAGVTFGCKMPGVFTVVPVLAATVVHHDLRIGIGRRLVLALAVVLLFGVTYFVTTPGSLLDPIRYFGTIAWEGRSYRTGQGVYASLRQCRLVLLWLLAVVPSPVVALAIPMSVVTGVGIAALWRQHRSYFWCSAAFVLAYATFMSAHVLLFVRNWLVFVPLAAIAFGVGVLACHDFARRRRLPWLLPVLLACVFAYNVAWLWIAAYSIRNSDPAAFAARLIDYMAGQPQRRFWLSPGAVSISDSDSAKRVVCAQNGRPSVSESDAVVFLAQEQTPLLSVFNRPWFYELTIGSHEINYDYYPVWIGRNGAHRIVVLAGDRARKRNMSLDGYLQCRVRS